MANCPFCNNEISEELSLYGGHCPHCLIEVPGEEAETDPGVQAAKVPATDNKKLFLISFAAMLVVGIGFLGFGSRDSGTDLDGARSVGPRPSVPLSAHKDQQYENEQAAKKKTASAAARKKRRQRNPLPSDTPTAEAAVPPVAAAPSGSAQAGSAQGSNESTSSGLGSAPVDMFSSIGAAPRSRFGPQGIVLEDAVKIEEMVARVLIRGRRDVNACFAQAKSANPSASGAWYVGFTVSKEGRPVGVGIERLSNKNSAVEGCIQTAVSGWRFQRVAEEIQVSDTFRMGG